MTTSPCILSTLRLRLQFFSLRNHDVLVTVSTTTLSQIMLPIYWLPFEIWISNRIYLTLLSLLLALACHRSHFAWMLIYISSDGPWMTSWMAGCRDRVILWLPSKCVWGIGCLSCCNINAFTFCTYTAYALVARYVIFQIHEIVYSLATPTAYPFPQFSCTRLRLVVT